MTKFHFMTAASLIAMMATPAQAQNAQQQNSTFSSIGKSWQNSNQNQGSNSPSSLYQAGQKWSDTESKKIKPNTVYGSIKPNTANNSSIFSPRTAGSTGTVDASGKVRSPNERPVER